MILNVAFEGRGKTTFKHFVNDNIEKFDEDLILFDSNEAGDYFPLDKPAIYNNFNILHYLLSLKNTIPYTYINGDVYLKENYTLIKKIINSKKKLEIIPDPWWSTMYYSKGLSEAHHEDYKYNICFLAGEPRLSRMLVIKELHHYNSFVWSNLNPNPSSNCELISEKHHKIINSESLCNKICYIKKGKFDSRHKKYLTEKKGNGNLNQAPIEYWQSIIDLVGESYTEYGTHHSEKTLKPLYWKKPFIAIGGRGFHSFLRDNEFELYDEIFDYSFDNEPKFSKRFESVIKQMKVILSMKIGELEKKINHDKLEHNKVRVMEIINERLKSKIPTIYGP